jgi:NADPH-dependent FMN reductase
MSEDAGPHVLAFAGSLRAGSYNRLALRYAMAGARDAGALIDEVGADALRLPLYDGDLERDGRFPDHVEAWRERVRTCDGLLIGSPEYNHGIRRAEECHRLGVPSPEHAERKSCRLVRGLIRPSRHRARSAGATPDAQRAQRVGRPAHRADLIGGDRVRRRRPAEGRAPGERPCRPGSHACARCARRRRPSLSTQRCNGQPRCPRPLLSPLTCSRRRHHWKSAPRSTPACRVLPA